MERLREVVEKAYIELSVLGIWKALAGNYVIRKVEEVGYFPPSKRNSSLIDLF